MKTIIANWKMNHAFDEADNWIDGFFEKYTSDYEKLKNIEMVLCPPVMLLDYIDSEIMSDSFQHLEEIMKASNRDFEDFSEEELNQILVKDRPLKLGAQNCHHENSGSFTGEVSAQMLSKVSCEYVILGHSERRSHNFESDEIVAKKVASVVSQKLIPIVCVGESVEIRNDNKHVEFVSQQLINSVPKNTDFERLIIAYEPIWSIGTGVTPSLDQISEMIAAIKKIFPSSSVLYGGSVTSQNSSDILKIPAVDGLLVGKASLDVNEFLNICLS